MKSLILITLLSSTTVFAALPAEIGNVAGWDVVEIPASEQAAKILTGHADATLIRQEPDSEVSLNINVKIEDENPGFKGAGASVKAWRKAIFGDRKFKLASESIVKKDNRIRYVMEFQLDVGTATPLHGMVMATAVGGKVYIFRFENDRDTYMKNLKDVKKALNDVTIKPSVAP